MFAIRRLAVFSPSVRDARIQTNWRCLPMHCHRKIVTLAIETSCDDTAVAILEARNLVREGEPRAVLHFHKKITSNSSAFRGVHPLVALESHQESLADLVNEALVEHTRLGHEQRPDFISVTRGPGMRSNLSTGLDTAKGLAVAWRCPLVGVHHMQAHALTPRLVAALQPATPGISTHIDQNTPIIGDCRNPEFPFLSVLVSGGHTLLVLSTSLVQHKVLATTADTAIGQYLDKVARVVLPNSYLETVEGTMYGALLERFAFADGSEEMIPQRQNKRDEPAGPAKPRTSSVAASTSPEASNVQNDEPAAAVTWPEASDAQGDEPRPASPWHEARDMHCDKLENYPYHGYVPPYSMEECTAEKYTVDGASKKGTGVKSSQYSAFSSQKTYSSTPVTGWAWVFSPPLSNSAGGAKHKSLEFSFSGLTSAVERAVGFSFDKTTGRLTTVERDADSISLEERRSMAREAMRAAFEHLASRIILGLKAIERTDPDMASKLKSVVVSGGVASNGYLRHILASTLTTHGYPNMRMYFPPPSLCTDNAAMIAWTGIEMWEAGFKDDYAIRAIRKWPLENLIVDIPKNG